MAQLDEGMVAFFRRLGLFSGTVVILMEALFISGLGDFQGFFSMQ
jgi:hypothetical protein